jgi:Short C-terminal domain/Phospholipase_D-nuclease N-terminal
MLVAADYPFLEVLWTMFVFFAWVIWFWLLIKVFMDVFRRTDISGWGKALWLLFVIVLPFLGVFIYLIANGREMGERDMERARAAQSQFDTYVQSVASSGSPAAEIERAKGLLDSGTITQEEYDAIKQKALAT